MNGVFGNRHVLYTKHQNMLRRRFNVRKSTHLRYGKG
jgi:hypothetical protein